MPASIRSLLCGIVCLIVLSCGSRLAEAAHPSAGQTFSIRIPGKIEVATLGSNEKGTSAVRVKSSANVAVFVERQSSVTTGRFPLLQANLISFEESFVIRSEEMQTISNGEKQSTIIITVVPH